MGALLPALVAGMLVFSTVACAAPTKKEAERQARALYRTGLASHNLAEYGAAIADFKQAYALTHAPGLLFNLAQSYRLSKDYEQALHFYRTYLRELPNTPNRRDVEGLIVKVEALLHTPPPMATPVPPPPTPQPEIRTVLVAAPVAPPMVVVHEKPKPHRRAWLTAGVVTLSVGVGALAAALGTGLHASAQSSRIDSLRGMGAAWDSQTQAVYTDGARSSDATIALAVVGGVLASTGLALTVVGARKPRDTGLTLRAHPLIGGGSLEATCAF